VVFHDLYAEHFDPVLPAHELKKDAPLEPSLTRHCQELTTADGIVVVHPNWWGQPPAILTGWVDRVLRPGIAYRFDEGDGGEGVPVGLLRARAAVVFNTSDTAPVREREVFGDPLDDVWRRCIFDLCGVKNILRKTYGVMVTSTPQQRASWLADVAGTVTTAFPP
jgi:NAD(P)H dehydrogenase (quinone)